MSDTSSPQLLTADEEADLLAVYGTHNPFYDELLQVQAPSQYRSIYETRNLFLTAGDADAADSGACGSDAAAPLDTLDCAGPLDLFVLRHLNGAFAASRPSSYADAMTLAVESLRGARFVDQSEHTAPLEQCRSAMSRIEAEVGMHGLCLRGPACGDDDDDFDKELQQLISDAEAEINRRNFHYDPAEDPEFQERLRQLRERELTPMHDDAFDDDAELLDASELAVIEAAATERCHEPVLLPEEIEDISRQRMADETNAIKRERMLEMQKIHMREIEKCGEEERKSSRSCFPDGNAQPLESLDDILKRIETISQRDEALQEQVQHEVRRAAVAHAHKAAEDFHREHREDASAKGLVAFDDFSKKIDSLIPPPIETVEDFGKEEAHPPDQPQAGQPQAKQRKKKTLQELKKASTKAEKLAKCEAQERRCMREEDDRVTALQRSLEARRILQRSDRDAMHDAEETVRRSFLGEEAVAHVEILVREERQRNNLLQLLQQRHMQQRAMVISELSQAFDDIRASVANVEAFEWTDLSSSERAERQALQSYQEKVDEMLREMERSIIRDQEKCVQDWWASLVTQSKMQSESILSAVLTVDAFGDQYPSSFEAAALRRLAVVDSCGFGARCEQLISAVAVKAHWTLASKNETAAALQALGVVLHTAMVAGRSMVPKRSRSMRSTPTPPLPRTPTPPSLSGKQAEASAACSVDEPEVVTLNDTLARKLLPLQFAAASVDVVRAPQVFHSLSFALESIGHVDCHSLGNLFVQSQASTTDSGGRQMTSVFEADRLRIAPYVKVLDLSSNSLSALNLDSLMETFSSLSTLHLSSNNLRAVQSEASSSTRYPSVTTLDVSANALSHLQLSAFPNMRRLFSFTNALADFAAVTEGCTNLHEIEMSRNLVTSLSGVERLPVLGTLDLSRNQLTAIDELRSATLLQKLFLSCNKIAQFPSGGCLLFLRQLFLNENSLTDIPSCIAWLPMLSDLHLDSNAIRSIEGLRGCQQLVTLKLAFNQLSNGVDDIRSLGACKRIRSLSLNDNPMMQIHSVQQEVETFVFTNLPLLREWNTDAVSKARVDEAHAHHQLTDASFVRGVLGVSDLESISLRSLHRWATLFSLHGAAQESTAALAKIPMGFAQDIMLERLQKERDSLQLYGHRKYQQALSQEENFKTRLKDRGGYLLGSLFMQSDSIEHRNYVSSLQQSQRHLEALREAVTLDTHMNVHTVSLSYERRARSHKEALAKRRLSEWIVGRLLIRKAKNELDVLREASEIGRQRRVLRAVLRIQPIWRGALIRKRLQAVRGRVDDDDELFQKVSFDHPDIRPLGFSNFNSLLQGAMLSHPQAPQFNVKAHRSEYAENGANRVGSAPTMLEAQRPQSNPVPPRSGSTAQQAEASFTPAKSARTTLDDEWGSALADQLRKKQSKMDKAKQSALRKEFISDPLKAKKMLGANGHK